MLEHLDKKVNFPLGARDERVVGLDGKMYNAFIMAGLKCPIFNEWHRQEIVKTARGTNADLGVSDHVWPFEVLGKVSGITDQDLGAWFEILNLGGSTMSFNAQGLHVTKYITIYRQEDGSILFKVNDDRLKTGFNDLAKMEYDMMMTLIHRGWKIWLGRVGLGDNEIPMPRLATIMDVELNDLMVRLGVFSDESIEPKPENALSCQGMFTQAVVVAPTEEAADGPSTSNPYQRVVDMEEELELSLMYEGAPSKAQVLGEKQITFNNPWEATDKKDKGKARLSGIVFGDFKPGAEAESPRGSYAAPTEQRYGNRPRMPLKIVNPENYEVVNFGPTLAQPQTTDESNVGTITKSMNHVTVEDTDDEEDGGAAFDLGRAGSDRQL
jgi:hypothetical protein